LRLYNNQLTTIPDTIGQLTALTELRLYNNQLTTIPDTIGQLRALTWLNLSHNQLTTIPDTIGQLRTLTWLGLSFNQLTTIPDTIGQLTALTELRLCNNQLTTIPDTIGQLRTLTWLGLSFNQLTTIPDTIGQLRALTWLSLSHNQLTTLPNTISQLRALTEFYYSENPFTTLPDLAQLTALSSFAIPAPYTPTISIDTLRVSIHECQETPEAVLERLVAPAITRVQFVDEEGQPDGAIDAGGPSRQLIAMLGKYLFDRRDSRVLTVSGDGMLSLPERALGNRDAYVNLGRLFSKIQAWNATRRLDATLGRVLDDRWFGGLLAYHRVPDKTDPRSVLQAVAKALVGDQDSDALDDVRWLFETPTDDDSLAIVKWYYGNRFSETQARQALVHADYSNEASTITVNDAFEWITTTYTPYVNAYIPIYEGMTTAAREHFFQPGDTETTVSTKIQGPSVTAELIVGNFNRAGITDETVLRKIGYLEAIIQENADNPAWLKRFLVTFTGASSITTETSLEFQSASGVLIGAHTCGRIIDIPREVPPDQADNIATFRECLDLTLAQSDSYQMG
ncbi:MAG: leucine-rich repeat domain-containing protein, partial [Verrucomicrobia bacterium]|nr:leucine-rich repeat domain-containing protein [Verrucomicrobiota bacterium]